MYESVKIEEPYAGTTWTIDYLVTNWNCTREQAAEFLEAHRADIEELMDDAARIYVEEHGGWEDI